MSRSQSILFPHQTYGHSADKSPRQWQMECLEAYRESQQLWESVHGSNGAAGQHWFTMYAGTGAGKTFACMMIAAHLLTSGHIGQVVLVCPNRSIKRKSIQDYRKDFGIDLAAFHATKHKDGIPRTKQGYVLTYQHLMSDPLLHRRICAPERTLVIFDEVHHLAKKNTWGANAVEAFGQVPYVLTVTGTPYRSEGNPIPFVTYEDSDIPGTMLFSADPAKKTGYTYSLGRAVADGVCRMPLFEWFDGTVMIRSSDGEEKSYTFDDKLSDAMAAIRLRGAVQYGSVPRRAMLETALARVRSEGRKVIIFLGGDTEGEQRPTEDATQCLPGELREMGYTAEDYEVVVGDDREAHDKIEKFGESDKWILISINMVSEGIDIKQISAAIFLTSITALQTTAQRIGRALRMREDLGRPDPHPNALIFMFGDRPFKTIAEGMGRDVDKWREIKLKQRQDPPQPGDGPEPARYRTEAIGIAGGEIRSVTFGGREYPIDLVKQKEQELRRRNLPSTMLHVVLSLTLEDHHVGHPVA